jgi:hypothetical protein
MMQTDFVVNALLDRNIMIELTKDITKELLVAMDAYKTVAHTVINKLINETDQPSKCK